MGSLVHGKQAPISWARTDGEDLATGSYDLKLVVGDNVNMYSDDHMDGIPSANRLYPDNLYVDLSRATGISINDLRQAILYQQMLEKDARSGTRYVEYLRSHFGVVSPDATQQRAEYLGGYHQPLNVNTVPQTSSSKDGKTPQANLAAFSESLFGSSLVHKTFLEHGYLIVVGCVRYDHSYQQGVEQL